MSDEWVKIGEQFLQQFFSSQDINVSICKFLALC